VQESNQEEEMKRMNNGVQGVSNQEEERKNRKPTQLDGAGKRGNTTFNVKRGTRKKRGRTGSQHSSTAYCKRATRDA